MILSDSEIERRINRQQIEVLPLLPGSIRPASVDLTLGGEFVQFRLHTDLMTPIDPFEPMDESDIVRFEADEFALAPGQFALATTAEFIGMPRDLAGRLEGKSSLARLGLVIHATAGFVDPGFRGQITLEIFNFAPRPILLRTGMKIAQMCFMDVEGTVKLPYGTRGDSKYQGQTGVTVSRYHMNQLIDKAEVES